MALTQVNPALLTGSSNTITTIQSNGTTAITINSSQAVSIGTTNVGGTLNTTTTSGNWGEIIYDSANNASMLAFRNNAGAAAGNISLSSAGATSLLMSSVAGVNFPATQVASSDANTLDDYEEGTWTPSLTGGGSPTGYTTRTAQYTKIGRLVRLTAYFVITGKGSLSGGLQISGFPFAVSSGISGGTQYFKGSARVNSCSVTGTNANALLGTYSSGGATSTVLEVGTTAGVSNFTDAMSGSTSDYMFEMTYDTN